MDLHELGWQPAFQGAFEALADPALAPARIVRQDRHRYLVLGEVGELAAAVSGTFRNTARARAEYPAVGNWVAIAAENQLTERFEVSRITVRRALQTLEHEGLIYRRQGLGSFVRDTQVRQSLVRLMDFVEDMAQAGLEASSQVLHRAPEPAAADVAEALGVPEGQTVSRLDRLRLADGDPIAFDRTWMPLFYAQLLEGHDLEHDTIYRILERDYNIPVERGRYRIEAVNAGTEIARYLDVPRRRALLLIERTSMTHGEKHVYFQRRWYRSDRVAYELELGRTASQPHTAHLRDFEPVFKVFKER